MQRLLFAATLGGFACAASAQFASTVVNYDPGTNAGGFNDPTSALGSPSRTSADGGATTPFSPASDPARLVTVGTGGSLTLSFDQPIVDNPPSVQFGVDLLVFGNALFFDTPYDPQATNPTATGIFGDDGLIEVSADGTTFFPVTGSPDGVFPTLGYSDVDIPYQALDPTTFEPEGPLPSGTVETDFTRSIDPSIDWQGMTFEQLLAAYDGSGGGTPIDFSSTGLSSVQYVRISTLTGSTSTPEIDAVADVVPEPGVMGLLAGALLLRRKR